MELYFEIILDPARKPELLQLPPIHVEGNKQIIPQKTIANNVATPQCLKKPDTSIVKSHEPISIKDKITELKMSSNSLKHWPQTKFNVS